MSKIILAIKPEFAEKILNGTKKFEYRKTLAKDVDTILLYETAPVQRVVGEVKVTALLKASMDYLWVGTRDYAGISKEYFDKYFNGREEGCAYMLDYPVRYKEPKALGEYGINHAPQSFVYVKE